MKKLIWLGLSVLPLLLPSVAFADTVITSPISTDTTWSPAGGVYIINSNFSVEAGATLTILPGTIIKSNSTNTNKPSIYGTLIAHGSALEPIYFTSIWDDALGGDTDGGGPTLGSDGHWQGLYFRPGSVGSLDYVDVANASYGGYGYGDSVGIENDGGTLDITHSNIHHNKLLVSDGAGGSMSSGTGIWNKSGILTMSDSIVEGNAYGVLVSSGTSTITNTIFKDNVDGNHHTVTWALSAEGPEPLTLIGNTFIGNGSTAQVDAGKIFVHSGNTSADLSGRGFAIFGIAKDGGVLRGGDLPIIGSFTVEAGTTYTIAPGTVIKVGDGVGHGAINVSGTLRSLGTKAQPIYFTSIRDDSVGGDTNGDGDATVPAGKNWGSIFLEAGSKAEFDNTFIEYGGYNYNGEYMNVPATIYQRGADLTISNSFLSHNNLGAAIFQDAGTTTITHSEIADNGTGIWAKGAVNIKISDSSLHGNLNEAIYYSQSVSVVDARFNYWGSSDGPKDQNILISGTGDGISADVSGDILYQPFLLLDPLLAPKMNPVIIIPGIMGSAEKNGVWYMDPILHTYDDLIATLVANGYIEGKTLFTFPYQWRDSNVLTATLLKTKINQAKQACSTFIVAGLDCTKVDIVAHSMGGLVAREYIEHGGYEGDVDQLIFLGTPHKGSPKAYLQWEAGEFPVGTADAIVKLYFQSEALHNFYSSLFNYIHGRPISSVQELLPIFDYIVDADTGVLRPYSSGYPRNIFLEALNGNTGLNNLLSSGVSITNIVGDLGGASTIDRVRVVAGAGTLWADGKPEGFDGQSVDRGLEKGSGDGTVTLTGATLDDSITNIISNSAHIDIPTAEEARVLKLLTNKDSVFDSHKGVVSKLLTIRLHSPIDMVVVAPDGKKMGKNFIDGSEYGEIPGAFYSGYGTAEEYITIPDPMDGEYKVQVQGTGSGAFGVVTSFISDDVSTSTELVGTTTSGQIDNVTILFDSADPTNLFVSSDIVVDTDKCLESDKDKKEKDRSPKKLEPKTKSDCKEDKDKEKEKEDKSKDRKVETNHPQELKRNDKDKTITKRYN